MVSKRSLRPDPNFDALISKIYPSRDEYEAHQDRVLAKLSRLHNQQALSSSIEEGLKMQAMHRWGTPPPKPPLPSAGEGSGGIRRDPAPPILLFKLGREMDLLGRWVRNWGDPGSCGQRLRGWMETSDEWWPLRVLTGTSTVPYLHQ